VVKPDGLRESSILTINMAPAPATEPTPHLASTRALVPITLQSSFFSLLSLALCRHLQITLGNDLIARVWRSAELLAGAAVAQDVADGVGEGGCPGLGGAGAGAGVGFCGGGCGRGHGGQWRCEDAGR